MITFREKILISIISGLLCGLWMKDRADAQGPSLMFGSDSSSAATVPIQTNGTNALKVLGK